MGKKRCGDYSERAWNVFVDFYATSEAPTMRDAFRKMVKTCKRDEALPSRSEVRDRLRLAEKGHEGFELARRLERSRGAATAYRFGNVVDLDLYRRCRSAR